MQANEEMVYTSYTHTPFLCYEAKDPQCRNNLWTREAGRGKLMQERLRSYLSLSQTLMFEDGGFPRSEAAQQLALSRGE